MVATENTHLLWMISPTGQEEEEEELPSRGDRRRNTCQNENLRHHWLMIWKAVVVLVTLPIAIRHNMLYSPPPAQRSVYATETLPRLGGASSSPNQTTSLGQWPSSCPSERESVILLLRHCEDGQTYRQPDLSRHCNTLGWQRAHYLALAAFGQRWPLPTHLYALAKSHNMRQYETLLPLSQRTGIPITLIDFYQNDASQALAHAVQQDLMEMCHHDVTSDTTTMTPMVTVVAWKHAYLPELARALRCDHCPAEWKDEDFDSVWQLHYHWVSDTAGPTVYASLVQQHFDPLAVQWQQGRGSW